jgi:hypothetical protein
VVRAVDLDDEVQLGPVEVDLDALDVDVGVELRQVGGFEDEGQLGAGLGPALPCSWSAMACSRTSKL